MSHLLSISSQLEDKSDETEDPLLGMKVDNEFGCQK